MATSFYRSGFIAADERAKSMQKYFEKTCDIKLTDRELYDLAIQGTSFLSSILRNTDYYARIEKIKEIEKERRAEGKPISKRTIAIKIIKIQQEYADLAGIFGRPSLKGIERRGGQEETIKETIDVDVEEGEDEDKSDETTTANMEL